MTYTEQAIQKAIEGGYKMPHVETEDELPAAIRFYLSGKEWCKITSDPLFWQSLGIGLGNKPVMKCGNPKCDYVQCEYAGYKDPKRMYDNFHESNWNGGIAESFFNSLINVKG